MGRPGPQTHVRLGLVSYLNARPIGYGLVSGRQRSRFEVVQSLPSELADLLARCELDLALIPSVEYARAIVRARQSAVTGRSEAKITSRSETAIARRNEAAITSRESAIATRESAITSRESAPVSRGETAIVPGIAIASRGAAESVLLFTRVPPARLRSIAVDRSSRTSVALLRLLLRRRLRPQAPEPELVASPPDLPSMLSTSEAALVIGDRALLAAREHPDLVRGLVILDLGTEWTAMTGLPFVFAFWAGPKRADSPEIVAALKDSLAEGLASIPEIARESAGGDAGLEAALHRYLTSSIRYRLGRDEIRGLETFYTLLAEARLLEGPAPRLSFHATAACTREPR